ncbi:MAG: hypothetical protein AAF757_30950, partial [Cyanobacteria bacterium P01_D01_bin.116]
MGLIPRQPTVEELGWGNSPFPIPAFSLQPFAFSLFFKRMSNKKLLTLLIVCIIFLTGCQSSPIQKENVTHLTLWQGVNPPSN